MPYLFPILLRYFALALQFLIIVLIAHHLTKEEVGVYFMIFGFINATYFLFGIGFPDGLVRFVALAEASNKQGEVRSLVVRSAIASMVSALLAVTLGIVISLPMVGGLLTLRAITITAAWWLAYGATFFASQVLVATRRPSLGAFFFYPAMNFALFVTLVPYLLLAREPTLQFALLAAVGGGILCTAAAVTVAARATLSYPPSTERVPIAPVIMLGLPIAISRLLQSCLYWVPVWAAGFWQGAAAAALFGTASRLNTAIASVMAAIRFTIRPVIVKYAATDNWLAIEREGRRTASFATAVALVAAIGVVTVGPFMIALVFGEAYRDAAWILAILMIGTLAECIGGAVDEVLKMTLRARLVLRILLFFVAVEILLVWLVSGMGLRSIAGMQAMIFVGMYTTMLAIVLNRNAIWVGATPSLLAFWDRDKPKPEAARPEDTKL